VRHATHTVLKWKPVCCNRRKSLALRFDGPMSNVQLGWLAAGPAAVRSLCFGPGEQRAFRVCGHTAAC
jgi:hypothetical protein